MTDKRILLIPDAYFGNYSGAYVAKIAKQLLIEIGFTVAIFSDEIKELLKENDGTVVYPRLKFSSKSYWIENPYLKEYNNILDAFRPDVVFTLGSVTNKPVCYWRIARERGIKTVSKIFMQDFFCTNFYANDNKGLCTRCLDSGFYGVFRGNCQPYHGNIVSNSIHKIVAAEIRKRLRKELILADAVVTSTRQQIEFYVKYGIPREHCYSTPLYFNGEKLSKYIPSKGDYYVFVAQNRIDKGIHLLKDILAHCNQDVKVVAAYTSQERINEALQKYGLQPFLDSGILEMRPNCTWKTDLGDVIAASRGVVNPSIWPSTTEYVLLEALGLKKPIFTFCVGIHSEIIETGLNGFVAETPLQMAEQLNDFFLNDQQYELVSQNAWTLYNKLTDWEGWINELHTIFDNIFRE